jgi:Response regulator of the LytR/AlgR family
MVNIIIIEDDKLVLQFCENALSDFNDEINLYKALSAEEALVLLEQQRIDGAFIDIDLPGISGFELVNKIRETERYHLLPVVFATGADMDFPDTYKQYHNFDYIEKPFTTERFKEQAKHFIEEIQVQKKLLNKTKEHELAFRCDDGVAVVYFSDILFATTTSKRKIRLITKQREYIRSDITLDNLMTEIDEEKFIRCSKSNIVNVSNIAEIKPVTYKTWDIYFRGENKITCQLSRSYRKEILNSMNNEVLSEGEL